MTRANPAPVQLAIRTHLPMKGKLDPPGPALVIGMLAIGSVAGTVCGQAPDGERPRAREVGIVIGTLPTGPHNAITDVPGVLVGQFTLREGTRFNTGVTAIRPHPGNLFEERVPAAIHVGNGFGKLIGLSQVAELGELETPILLTGTLGVWKAADAMVGWMLEQPGMEKVRSINPVVGETNDGQLNDIRARPLAASQVVRALEGAKGGPVDEGSVGAGTGTVAFEYKGGIGTSSRRVRVAEREFTLGVLVQSNFGGDLVVAGVPVGRRLAEAKTAKPGGDGSIMIVVATDAPMDARLLDRLAHRALLGLGRTGSVMSNGSGDYVIAFSTAGECRRPRGRPVHAVAELSNEVVTPLFQATVEATEEAILNSLFRATTVAGHRRTAEALPLGPVLDLLESAGMLVGEKRHPQAPRPDQVDPALALPSSAGGDLHPFRCPRDGGKAAVVLFLTIDCPIANRYAPEIERIRLDYAGQGVGLTLVHVDPDLSDEAALVHAREFGLGAPVAVDRAHAVVGAAGARITPEAVVVDPGGRIRYRGRIDDQFADFGARRVEPSTHDLREALDALIAGKPVAVPETEALGCHIPPLEATGR